MELGQEQLTDLAGKPAVVEAAEEPAEEVALGGGVPVAGVFAAVTPVIACPSKGA